MVDKACRFYAQYVYICTKATLKPDLIPSYIYSQRNEKVLSPELMLNVKFGGSRILDNRWCTPVPPRNHTINIISFNVVEYSQKSIFFITGKSS